MNWGWGPGSNEYTYNGYYEKLLLLLVVALMVACQTEKDTYIPASSNDNKNKQNEESEEFDTTAMSGNIYIDRAFTVAIVNEKGGDLIAKNISATPLISAIVVVDSKKCSM